MSSRKDRLAARNAALTKRSQEKAPEKPEMSPEEIKKKVQEYTAQHTAALAELGVFHEKMQKAGMELRTRPNDHYIGEGSTRVNVQFKALQEKLNRTKSQLHQFRMRNDPIYKEEKEADKRRKEQDALENQAKVKFWTMACGTKTEEKQKVKQGVEVILRYHWVPHDTSTSLDCKHFYSETLQPLKCDCTYTLKCGCLEYYFCEVCKKRHCEHAIEHRVRMDDLSSSCQDHTHRVMSIVSSQRAAALQARQKLMVRSPKVRITRMYPGLIITNDPDRARYIRCYHQITDCDQNIPCDCTRNTATGVFTISPKYAEMGIPVILDDSTVRQTDADLQRVPPGAAIPNPTGLLGHHRPSFQTTSPAEHRKQEETEIMNSQMAKIFAHFTV